MLGPQTGVAQGQAKQKSIAFEQWRLICRNAACAIAHQGVRTVVIFGFNKSDGKLVMQVRVPPEASENRPMALRLHKSGTLLHLRVDSCRKEFCSAAAAADRTRQVIDLFSKESSGTVAYQLGQQLQIEVFSLRGFSKAMAELAKRKP